MLGVRPRVAAVLTHVRVPSALRFGGHRARGASARRDARRAPRASDAPPRAAVPTTHILCALQPRRGHDESATNHALHIACARAQGGDALTVVRVPQDPQAPCMKLER
ncbi:hypothetical protein LSCM1_07803 [Leishmania martiniquensis]|uniref:Uncharacterized protein n=1 Tax=Leishmania martiniquensis TaxID=1580590 RepID=A0A836HJ32_9TRYP|nr:hypothetical protein LSCM1_07800 [Leishmania martiniquensis]KAG5487128.1 hypothetical protein LSCM1_07801 [Leishmania martiniquensis]KAG5487130.1 hypothetical protein LSCM1_07803 [Leishmania martiniquensis]